MHTKKDQQGKSLVKVLTIKPDFKITKSDEGVIKAYVSIFGNIDSDGDIIVRGAFLESLAKKMPVGVWSHNWEEPIAKTLTAGEDEKGLLIEAQFILEVQKAKEAFELIKSGVINEFSIGFRILDWEYNEAGNRVIKKVRLYEWSPVVAGANPDTQLLDVKCAKFDETFEKDGEAGDHSPTPPESTPPPTETAQPSENSSDPIGQGSGEEIPPKTDETPAPDASAPINEDKPENEGGETGKQLDLTELKVLVEKVEKILEPIKELLAKQVSPISGDGKVATDPATKVLQIRQSAKQMKKNAEFILRISK